MKTVTLSKEQEIRLGPYEYAATLFPGIAYILSDRDAEGIVGKAGGSCKTGEPACRAYRGDDLTGKSLLYTVLGDYREALLDLQSIRTLKGKFPSAVIDVAATIDTYMLLQQFSFRGAWRAYPFLGESAAHYDYLFSSENIFDPFFQSGKEVLRKFRALTGGDFDPSPFPPSLNPAIRRTMALKKPAHATAVLDIAGNGRIADYPMTGWRELIRLLRGKNMEVIACGYAGKPDLLAPLQPENILGKDFSALEIVALLSQADLVIAGDSFAARAASLLGKETIVLLNAEDPEYYEVYPRTEVISPAAPCVPCYRNDRCPLGYEVCEAFAHESAAPSRILERALLKLENGRKTGAGNP